MVFHDPELDRMTGATGPVRDRTPEQLARLTLLDTTDTIETLQTHLDLIDGAVPVILELKGGEGHDSGFVEGVAKALSTYQGPVAVMSFNHHICAQFKPLMPSVPRGLTAQGDDTTYQRHKVAMDDYDLNFVSYRVRELDTRFVSDMRRLGLPVITWTVRTIDEQKRSATYADQMTFEGFDPGKRSHELG